MDFLSGYKTYIIAFMLLAVGILGMFGIDIPGAQLPDNWLVLVLNGLGLGGLRLAVSKSGPA